MTTRSVAGSCTWLVSDPGLTRRWWAGGLPGPLTDWTGVVCEIKLGNDKKHPIPRGGHLFSCRPPLPHRPSFSRLLCLALSPSPPASSSVLCLISAAKTASQVCATNTNRNCECCQDLLELPLQTTAPHPSKLRQITAASPVPPPQGGVIQGDPTRTQGLAAGSITSIG